MIGDGLESSPSLAAVIEPVAHTLLPHWQLYLASTYLLLLVPLALSLLAWRGAAGSRNFLIHECTFVFISLAVFLYCRVPYLALLELNPDESQSIAGARKLLEDPLFWRSVDGHTNGPLASIPLLFPHLFGIAIDYGSARFMGLIATFLTFLFLLQSVKILGDSMIARLAVLPYLWLTCTYSLPDFLHQSSETITVLILALSCFLLCRIVATGPTARTAFSLGLALGLIPFSKLQAVPIGAVIGVAGLTVFRRDLRAMSVLIAGTLLVPTVVFTILAATGVFADFWRSYILANISYAGRSLETFGEKVLNYIAYTATVGDVFPFILGGLVSFLLSLTLVPTDRTLRFFVVTACPALLLAAAYSIAQSGYRFPHYLQLLTFPLALSSALAFTSCLARASRPPLRSPLVAFYLGTALIFPGVARASLGHFVLSQPKLFTSPGISNVVHTIRQYGSPGEKMGVWGWEPRLYVESGLVMATRDAVTAVQIFPSPLQRYFQTRFLGDLRRSDPPIFVDAVGPQRQGFRNRPFEGHEAFRWMNRWLNRHYRSVADIQGFRIYVRRERLREIEQRTLARSSLISR